MEAAAASVSNFMESDDSDDLEALLLTSSSSSDCDSDNEELLLGVQNNDGTGQQQKQCRIKYYVESVVPEYTREQFKSHFRMYPETFKFIMSLVGPFLSATPQTPGGRKPIDAEKQMLLSLWVMGTPDSLRSVSEKFDVGRATALRSVRKVSYALHSLAPRFIKWPKGEQAKQVMEQYERYSAFPKIIGSIDGTHVPIRAPTNDPRSYVNRKGFHSIQVQAVCTHDLLFTSVFAGNAGCVHDARVFRLSPVHEYMAQPEEYFPEDSHLVGDSAYAIQPHLMTPFRDNGHLTAEQKNFNFCLSSARMSIERAFGMWKARWRRVLDCLPMTRIDKIPEFILATCVLHNICILNGDLLGTFNEAVQPSRRNRGQLGLGPGELTEAGIVKRTQIMNSLIMRDN